MHEIARADVKRREYRCRIGAPGLNYGLNCTYRRGSLDLFANYFRCGDKSCRRLFDARRRFGGGDRRDVRCGLGCWNCRYVRRLLGYKDGRVVRGRLRCDDRRGLHEGRAFEYLCRRFNRSVRRCFDPGFGARRLTAVALAAFPATTPAPPAATAFAVLARLSMLRTRLSLLSLDRRAFALRGALLPALGLALALRAVRTLGTFSARRAFSTLRALVSGVPFAWLSAMLAAAFLPTAFRPAFATICARPALAAFVTTTPAQRVAVAPVPALLLSFGALAAGLLPAFALASRGAALRA